MDIALLVVGDEILSGKRRDGHFAKLTELLAERGMELSEARFVGDDEARIAAAAGALVESGHVVLSCGGIGATPDDRTRQAVARAFGRPIQRHPEAEALIVEQFGERAFPNRVLMADFPTEAGLIPNPINHVAGFFIHPVYCVPGFPEMAWPMLEWVLDGPLRAMHRSDPPQEYSLRVMGTRGEGDLLEMMETLLALHPGVNLSSLPHRGSAESPRHIELGVKGPAALASTAYGWLDAELHKLAGVTVEALKPPLKPPVD